MQYAHIVKVPVIEFWKFNSAPKMYLHFESVMGTKTGVLSIEKMHSKSIILVVLLNFLFP